MGELETTGGTGGTGGGGFDPPRGDEGLDDWLTRRLEAQGIVANRAGFPTARILAVLGLVVALGALFWVISGTGGSSTESPTPTHPTGTTSTTTSTGGTQGGGKKNGTKVDWRTVPLTVLNGYGATGAAGGDAAAPAGDQGTPPPANAVSGNPAATNIVAGTGRLGEILGINRNGIRVGGLQINDANGNLVGGLGPGKWTGGTLTIADLPIDLNSGVREDRRYSGGFIEHFHLNAKGQVDDTRYRLVADEEPQPERKRTRTASRSARARAEAEERVQMQRQPVGGPFWGWGVQWDNGGNRERFGGRDF